MISDIVCDASMPSNADIGSYILARDAALRTHLHPDYISRLARQSKIASHRKGKRWYVDPVSLEAFLSAQSAEKEAWRRDLKQKRRKEYKRSVHAPMAVIEEKLATTTAPQVKKAVDTTVRYANMLTPGAGSHAASYVIHPGFDFAHRLTAMFFAILIVFGTYAVFDREFGNGVAVITGETLSNVAAAGFVLTGNTPECSSILQRTASVVRRSVGQIAAAFDAAMPDPVQHTRVFAPCTP